MTRLSDSEDRKRTDPPRQATIVHLFHGSLRDGEEITTLCEAAWQLADIPIPRPEQGTRW